MIENTPNNEPIDEVPCAKEGNKCWVLMGG